MYRRITKSDFIVADMYSKQEVTISFHLDMVVKLHLDMEVKPHRLATEQNHFQTESLFDSFESLDCLSFLGLSFLLSSLAVESRNVRNDSAKRDHD